MTPRRVQRRRTKGWRLPEGAVYVGRPTRFGNPFFIGSNQPDVFVHDGVVVLWSTPRAPNASTKARREAVRRFREWFLTWVSIPGWGGTRNDLRGRDLACWCALCEVHREGKPLGVECADCAPCHADVLLEWANEGVRDAG